MIGRYPEPRTDALRDGERLHAVVERWLATGELSGAPKDQRIVEEEIPFLPRPGTVGVEVKFCLELDGVLLQGVIDVLDAEHQRIEDHKFVGTFEYALTPEDLRTDWQACIYALVVPWPRVALRWNYVSKARRECRPVDVEVTREACLDVVRREVLPLAREMASHLDDFAGARGPSTVDRINQTIPCEPADCWSFGTHCPHGARCTHRGHR